MIKKPLFFFLFVLTVSNNALSFTSPLDSLVNDIIKTRKYRKGVYSTFDEFRKNSPSVEKFYYKRDKLDGEKIKLFDSITKKEIKGKVWGFSTGDNIYINTYYVPTQGGKNKLTYAVFTSIDRYCIFYYKYSISLVTGGSPGSVPRWNTTEGEYLMGLNINNGKTFEITNDVLKIILEKDPDLLRRYEEERPKDRDNLKYLLEYNERNREQIESPF